VKRGHLLVIDLHSHIVPAVDDGARNLAESAQIIDAVATDADSGSTIVLTPHFASSMHKRVVNARINAAFRVQDILEKQYQDRLNFLVAGELMLNTFSSRGVETLRYPGTGWILVEFSLGVSWIETLVKLKKLINKGYSPLLAHPERYKWCRRNSKKLIKLSEMGCGIIVSARSLLFKKYAVTARTILKQGLAHALCSDAHSPKDLVLNDKLRSKYLNFSDVPWELVTNELPNKILNDYKLPNLPLINRRKLK